MYSKSKIETIIEFSKYIGKKWENILARIFKKFAEKLASIIKSAYFCSGKNDYPKFRSTLV